MKRRAASIALAAVMATSCTSVLSSVPFSIIANAEERQLELTPNTLSFDSLCLNVYDIEDMTFFKKTNPSVNMKADVAQFQSSRYCLATTEEDDLWLDIQTKTGHLYYDLSVYGDSYKLDTDTRINKDVKYHIPIKDGAIPKTDEFEIMTTATYNVGKGNNDFMLYSYLKDNVVNDDPDTSIEDLVKSNYIKVIDESRVEVNTTYFMSNKQNLAINYQYGFEYFLIYKTGKKPIYVWNASTKEWEFVCSLGDTSKEMNQLKLDHRNLYIARPNSGGELDAIKPDSNAIDNVEYSIYPEDVQNGTVVSLTNTLYPDYALHLTATDDWDTHGNRLAEVTYKFVGNYPYLYDYKAINNFYGGKLEDGSPLFANDFLRDESGNIITPSIVTLYEGATPLLSYTSDKLNNLKAFKIPNYDPNKTYMVEAVNNSMNTYSSWYKLDPKTGEWILRVDTSKTPIVDLEISGDILTNELAGGEVIANKGKDNRNFSESDFVNGFKFDDMDITNGMDDQIVFNYDTGDKNPDTTGDAVYVILGIDPVYDALHSTDSNSNDKVKKNKVGNIQTNAKAGDILNVIGELEDGTQVNKDIPITEDNQTIPLWEGQYVVTSKDNALIANADVDQYPDTDGKIREDSSDFDSVNNSNGSNYVINVSEPELVHTYSLDAIDGTHIDSGEIDDDALDNINDTNLDSYDDAAKYGKYIKYEERNGVGNSIDPLKNGSEKGYAVVNPDGTITKVNIDNVVLGDVNLDGSVNLLDVIALQKYALNITPFSDMRQFIQADVTQDGEVDVFDLAVLKKMIANK